MPGPVFSWRLSRPLGSVLFMTTASVDPVRSPEDR